MGSTKDYYEILGIGREATDEQIRHAYRKMALRYHPDKNPGDKEESAIKFHEIAEAFDVLGDKEKKEVYDRFGAEGLEADFDDGKQHQQGYHGFSGDAEQFFAQFFNEGGIFNRPPVFDSDGVPMANSSRSFGADQGLPKSPPILHEVALSLEELFSGTLKKMKVTRLRKGVSESTVLTIEVRQGWKAGTRITFFEEGDELPDFSPADIIFIIQEKPHALFKRLHSHLLHEVKISLKQALTGFVVEVIGIDGQKLRIRVKALPMSSYRKVVTGHGMPFSKRPDARGDLIITFIVEFPPALTDSQRSQMLSCLP